MRSSLHLAIWAAIFFLFQLSQTLLAHDLNSSYTEITVRPEDNAISTVLIVDVTDLKQLFQVDENDDGAVTPDELEIHLQEMQDYFFGKLHVELGGDEIALESETPVVTGDGIGNTFVKFGFHQTVEALPWKLTLRLNLFEDFSPLHKNLVKVTRGGEFQQAILTIDYPEYTFSFSGDDVSLFSQSAQFIWLGMEHIFIGYDHILFLLGLILLGGKLMNLVKMVTAFTIAHSITLILAALHIVTLPGRLVECVIALSIVYIAVENFVVRDSEQRWVIAFVFGLMHGFGFANVLSELGLPTSGLIVSLLSFNVGVEIGQITIVAFMFPAIVWISRSAFQKRIVYAVSSLILVLGLVWFLERALNLSLPLL